MDDNEIEETGPRKFFRVGDTRSRIKRKLTGKLGDERWRTEPTGRRTLCEVGAKSPARDTATSPKAHDQHKRYHGVFNFLISQQAVINILKITFKRQKTTFRQPVSKQTSAPPLAQ